MHFLHCAYSAHMTRDDLARGGAALYGRRWQAPLAADLGVHHQTMRRWVSGEIAMPEEMVNRLWRLLHERRAEFDDILEGE